MVSLPAVLSVRFSGAQASAVGDGASLGATDAALGATLGAALAAGDGVAPPDEQAAAIAATKARAVTPLTVRMSLSISS